LQTRNFTEFRTGATDEIYLMEEGQMDICSVEKKNQLDVTLYSLFIF